MDLLRSLRRWTAAFAAFSVLCLAVAAQVTVDWQQETPIQSPSPRSLMSMTYDPVHQEIVLFGGYINLGGGIANETWTYDGTTWTQRTPATSPPPRAASSMAFDVPTQRVILFGGFFSGTYLGDTWVWDGTNWTQSTSGAAPTPVTGPMLFNDPITHGVLLFGGYDGHFYKLDMYQWTANGWAQLNPTTVPSARARSIVASDPPHSKVVLFGGVGSVSPHNTWTWDGSNWTQEFPNNQPPLISYSSAAFDPAIGHPIFFGGTVNLGPLAGDTWEWTVTDWTQLFPQHMPTPRASIGLAYDEVLGHIVLFGGDSGILLGDTWSVRVTTTCCQAFCPGDGSGTACPCGNASAIGSNSGCLSSLNVGGQLVTSGIPSLTNDTVVLQGTSMPNGSALYFQGTTQVNGGLGSVFGDGLRCAAGTVVRLGTTTNVGGASQYPFGTSPAIHVKGNITQPGTRAYQVWYRNAAAFCTPSTFNLTNGWQLSWTP